MHFIPLWSTVCAVLWDNFSLRESTEDDGQVGKTNWKHSNKSTQVLRVGGKGVHHHLSIPEGCIQLEIIVSLHCRVPISSRKASTHQRYDKMLFAAACIFQESSVRRGILCLAAAPIIQQPQSCSSRLPAYSTVVLES